MPLQLVLFGVGVVKQQFNWLSAVVCFCFTPKTSSDFFVVAKSLHMDSDPYDEFARQHGDVAGRTRGICADKAAQRKRKAYIRHRVAEGEDPEQVAVAHQGGQARPLYTPRT